MPKIKYDFLDFKGIVFFQKMHVVCIFFIFAIYSKNTIGALMLIIKN